jgi:hypothetical protein
VNGAARATIGHLAAGEFVGRSGPCDGIVDMAASNNSLYDLWSYEWESTSHDHFLVQVTRSGSGDQVRLQGDQARYGGWFYRGVAFLEP